MQDSGISNPPNIVPLEVYVRKRRENGGRDRGVATCKILGGPDFSKKTGCVSHMQLEVLRVELKFKRAHGLLAFCMINTSEVINPRTS